MPKAAKAQFYVNNYSGVFRTDRALLFYTFCETNVSCDWKSQVPQHLETSKHFASNKTFLKPN